MQEVKNYINGLDEVTTPLFVFDLISLSIAFKKCASWAGLKSIRIHNLLYKESVTKVAPFLQDTLFGQNMVKDD